MYLFGDIDEILDVEVWVIVDPAVDYCLIVPCYCPVIMEVFIAFDTKPQSPNFLVEDFGQLIQLGRLVEITDCEVMVFSPAEYAGSYTQIR
jgi:hypothetical protein